MAQPMMHGDEEGAKDPGGPTDSEQGQGEGIPPEAIDATMTVLMMLAKAGGPNADLFKQAFGALQSQMGGDQGAPTGPQPEQAGTNPNAVPMR